MKRARVVTLNAALGPLDYRVPDGMAVEPGSVVVAPLGPRQLLGVAWEAERLPTNEVPDSRLRPLGVKVDAATANIEVRKWLRDTANVRLHGTTERAPADLLTEELGRFLPLAVPWQGDVPRSAPVVSVRQPLESIAIQHPLSVYEGLLAPEVVP